MEKIHQDLNKKTGDVFVCESAHFEGNCDHTVHFGEYQMLKLINDTYEGKNTFCHISVIFIEK
ncbi:MAG: hypothetical protein J7M01_04600 [Candidatus Marinimicrobia bacterium]|nr:hypothetical protein [Candidatus Neomarinimicrobiota bacterium]